MSLPKSPPRPIQCIFYNSQLGPATKPEHILLNALGGRKTSRDLFTLVTALSEIQALLPCAFQEADMILSDYRSYLEHRIERVMAFRAQQLTSTK
jgi:hypothetical protein